MGLRSLLPGIRPAEAASLSAAVAVPAPLVPMDVVSPLAPTSNLARVLDGVVFSDVWGTDVLAPLTRGEAMAVPAVARGRHIITGTGAGIPLRAYRGTARLDGPARPSWLNTGMVSPYHRMLWTLDDFVFYGWSCWARTNGADGYPTRMDRIPMGRWSVDEVGRVKVDRGDGVHVLVDQRSAVLLPGPHAGILTEAATTIRHAADLQRAAAVAAEDPAAYIVLKQTQGLPLPYDSDDPTVVTVRSTLRDWKAARRDRIRGGGVGFVPLGLDVDELGGFSEHLLVEGRNAAAVDVARVLSLPADLLDANGTGSLTYQTTRDNDLRAIQYGVGFYLRALSAALSMDGITPHGQEVRFDVEDWLEDPVTSTAQPAARPQTPAPAPAPEETPA